MNIETKYIFFRKRLYLTLKIMSYFKLFVFVVSLLFVVSAFSQKQQSIAQGKWAQTDTTQTSENFTTRGSFTVNVISTNVSCFGRCDGTITITISGSPTYPVQIRLTKLLTKEGALCSTTIYKQAISHLLLLTYVDLLHLMPFELGIMMGQPYL